MITYADLQALCRVGDAALGLNIESYNEFFVVVRPDKGSLEYLYMVTNDQERDPYDPHGPSRCFSWEQVRWLDDCVNKYRNNRAYKMCW